MSRRGYKPQPKVDVTGLTPAAIAFIEDRHRHQMGCPALNYAPPLPERCHCGLPEALRAIVQDLPRLAREALFDACPHPTKYGDDGELQCDGFDFARSPGDACAEHLAWALLASRGSAL